MVTNFSGFNYDPGKRDGFSGVGPLCADVYCSAIQQLAAICKPLAPKPDGVWEILLKDDTYRDRLTHQSKVKLLVHSESGWFEKIPSYIRRVVQDPATLDFAGQFWAPPRAFDWEGDHFVIRRPDEFPDL